MLNNKFVNFSDEYLLEQKYHRLAYIGLLISGIVMGVFVLIDLFLTKYYIDAIVELIGSIILLSLAYIERKYSLKKWAIIFALFVVAGVLGIVFLSNNAEDGIIAWLAIFPFFPFFVLGEKQGLWVSLGVSTLFMIALCYLTIELPQRGFTWVSVVSTLGALITSTLLAYIYEKNRSDMIRNFALEATTDHLTGLLNRRGLMAMFNPLLSLFQRTNKSICFLVLDLDYFKLINDEYGHDIGDKVLVHTSQLAKQLIREGDLLARLGGEEFLIVLPDTSLDVAKDVAERIRSSIEISTVVTEYRDISITTSIGLSCMNAKDTDFDTLFDLADKALYKAKSQGRNCVEYDNLETK